tara:strand:+ start:2403 stop:2825 length:423 start_codon:yes stop_codon:yes gene_type:complete
MIPVPEVTKVDLAFPAMGEKIAPERKDIPEEFKCMHGHGHPYWEKFWAPVWYQTREHTEMAMAPREGVDAEKAYKALSVVLGCYGISQERKMEAMAFLTDQWFEHCWFKGDDKTILGEPFEEDDDEHSDSNDSSEQADER